MKFDFDELKKSIENSENEGKQNNIQNNEKTLKYEDLIEKYDNLIDREFPSNLTIRPEQRETLRRICHAFESGKLHFIAQLPTGVGKSLIAITFGKIVNKYFNKKTTLITKTKALQDQYMNEFPFLVDIKGINNYPCLKESSIHYGDANCIKYLKKNKCNKERCPYIKARTKWSKNEFIRTTNMTLMNKCSKMCLNSEEGAYRSDVLIIDECHKLPTELVENGSLVINLNDKEKFEKEASIYSFNFEEINGTLFEFIKQLNEKTKNYIINIDFVDLKDIINVFSKYKNRLKKMIVEETAEKFHFNLLKFIEENLEKLNVIATSYGNYVFFFDEHSNSFKLMPLRAYSVNGQIFSKADFFLHMSATIGDINQYMKEMGMNPSFTDYYEIDSPFPIENRKILYIPLIKFSYVNQNEAINIIAQAIDKVIEENEGRGIIHTSSYYFAKKFKELSKYKKQIRIPEKSEEVIMYMNMNYHIMSPSLQEGYDFKDDLARWQILTKVPYPSLGDIYTKVKMNFDKDWYYQETANKIIQSYGRAIRHKDDYAVFYIFDANFDMFKNSKFIPKYIRDAIEEI